MEELDYYTYQRLKNKEGEITGWVRVWVFSGEDVAYVEYKCPYCGHEGKLKTKWKRPFRFRCENCGRSILVPKLNPKKGRRRRKRK